MPTSFDAFREWALAASSRAARRWEDPHADEMPILYGQDCYDDRHEIPVPPIYLRHRRGHIGWLTQQVPVEVANRSLYRLCLRISVWTGDADKYNDLSADPVRTELLLNIVAEHGRREVWQAPIHRDKSGVPTLGSWEEYDADPSQGPLLHLIDDALRHSKGKRGRTMPAANMVLGPYDVPTDFFPDYRVYASGPIDWVGEDRVVSSYKAAFRTEQPDHVIVSVCYVFTPGYGLDDHIHGALGALSRMGNREFDGPRMGERSHRFDGPLDNGRLHKYQVLWSQGNVLCELGLVGPPGYFKAHKLNSLAATQHARLDSELRAPLATPD